MASRQQNATHEQPPYTAQSEGDTGRGKRIATAILGGVLVVRGFGRRSLRGIAMALAGGWLLSRALGDDDPVDRIRSLRTGYGGDEQKRSDETGETTISRSVTIGKSADELYEAWRDPDVFSRIVGHVADVESLGGDRFIWTVDGPLDRTVSWETRVVEAVPGELVRWETPTDARIRNEGSVRFRPAPGDRGTEVTLEVTFDTPGGRVGAEVLKLLEVVPEALAGRALDRFKSLVETGVIPTTDRNPSARGNGDLV